MGVGPGQVVYVVPTKVMTKVFVFSDYRSNCSLTSIRKDEVRIATTLSTGPSSTTVTILTPCRGAISDVVSPIVKRDTHFVSHFHPRDRLSGLMTSVLHCSTSTCVNHVTSIKIAGVKKLHATLPRKSVACNGVCRVAPFRGALYVIAVGKILLHRLFRGVTTIRNRKLDNTYLRVSKSKGLLSTAITKGRVRSSGRCGMTALSCLTRKGSRVATFTGINSTSGLLPRGTAIHRLFLGCIGRRAGTKGGVSSGVRKEVAIGRWARPS